MKQAYDVAHFLGNGSAVAVIGMLAYIIGLLGVTLGDSLRRGVGTLEGHWGWLSQWWQWQAHARRVRKTQLKQRKLHEAGYENAPDGPHKQAAKHTLDQHTRNIDIIRRASFLWGLFVHRSADVLQITGSPQYEGPTAEDLAESAVAAAWATGVEDELNKRETHVDTDSVRRKVRNFDFDHRLLNQDLGFDPLDALRALDPSLYQAFDRERSEREFRIAVMPPVVALCIYFGGAFSPYGYVGAVVALFTLILAAVRQSHEAARVLNNIMLKGHSLPSMRAAQAGGRLAVLEHLSEQQKKKPK